MSDDLERLYQLPSLPLWQTTAGRFLVRQWFGFPMFGCLWIAASADRDLLERALLELHYREGAQFIGSIVDHPKGEM